jgi:uncharacterized phage protein (TIGR01671 family)
MMRYFLGDLQMTRKIKFRAWDNINKKMLSWKEIALDKDILSSVMLNEFYATIPPKYFWQRQQYTGLRDMDGVEIFEGDILQEEYSDKDYPVSRLQTEIKWSKAYSGFQWCEHRLDDGDLADFYGGVSQTDYKKVVGNIFEGIKE